MFSLSFNHISYLLLFFIVLGLISHNSAITISAAVLLIMQQTPFMAYIPIIDQYGLKLGILILTLGVLSPLVSGRIPLPDWQQLFNFKMFLAIATGLLVAYLGGRGANLMGQQPLLITGLLIGTILGVALFKGVPVGPLIAAGILSILLQYTD